MLVNNALIGFGSAVPAASLVYVTNAVDTGNTSSYTFNSQSLGVEDPSRKILVAVSLGAVPVTTINSLTVAGIAASQVATVTTSNVRNSFYIADVPSGTTGTIALTAGIAGVGCGVSIFALYNALSSTAFHTNSQSTNSNPSTTSINIPSEGVAIAMGSSTTTLATQTWSGLTEAFDAVVDASSAFSFGGAIRNTTGEAITGQSVSVTYTAGAEFNILAASFR